MQENQITKLTVNEGKEVITEINGFHVAMFDQNKCLQTTDPAKVGNKEITIDDIIEIMAKLGFTEWNEAESAKLREEYAEWVEDGMGEMFSIQICLITEQESDEETDAIATDENSQKNIFICIGYVNEECPENCYYLECKYCSGIQMLDLIPTSVTFMAQFPCFNASINDTIVKLIVAGVLLAAIVFLLYLLFTLQ